MTHAKRWLVHSPQIVASREHIRLAIQSENLTAAYVERRSRAAVLWQFRQLALAARIWVVLTGSGCDSSSHRSSLSPGVPNSRDSKVRFSPSTWRLRKSQLSGYLPFLLCGCSHSFRGLCKRQRVPSVHHVFCFLFDHFADVFQFQQASQSITEQFWQVYFCAKVYVFTLNLPLSDNFCGNEKAGGIASWYGRDESEKSPVLGQRFWPQLVLQICANHSMFTSAGETHEIASLLLVS